MRASQLLGAAVVIAAAAAACGPSPEAESPTSPAGGGNEPAPSATPTTGEAPSPTPDPGAQQGKSQPGKPAPHADSLPIMRSKMLGKVKDIGIDLKKPPSLSKMPLGPKKKIMPLFQEALGFKDCTGCHVSDTDFKKVTRNMEMARNMWAEYVVKLRDVRGEALFCDSCHQGKSHLLERGSADTVKAFMEAEYQDKLTRADGNEHNCFSCHGDGMETKIFEKLWKVRPPG